MSQSQARRRALRKLSDDSAITPLGEASVQEHGGTLYMCLPIDTARADGIEKGSTMLLGYEASSSTYLAAPKHKIDENSDHWAADQL